MKKYIMSFACAILVLIITSGACESQVKGFNKIKWNNEKIAPGLIWKSSHCVLNDSVPQNINILMVNLKKRKIRLVYNPLKNIQTSIQARDTEAMAAVNAGFFNVKNGGSATYIKIAGRIVDSDTAKKWPQNTNLNGAIMIRSSNEIYIVKTMPNAWFDSHQEYEDILVTGPLLVDGNTLSSLPQTSLVTNKHPRTAIGSRNSRKIILITVDGRATEAGGMTLNELADFMLSLRCRDAINLDGGGSTTMWISGKPFNGVVNMPSDNKKFDHEGERAVSNILIIK
ncbi:MAG: phosphodiester glycosidase family protein [Bacteroidales bacterium]|jgi:exopolysaccharide biosynthesis protein|nr:phosphodiester glycosidase family protein [Bacteroidales bacterium]